MNIRRLLYQYQILVVREIKALDDLLHAQSVDRANGLNDTDCGLETEVLFRIHRAIERLRREVHDEICDGVEDMEPDEPAPTPPADGKEPAP